METEQQRNKWILLPLLAAGMAVVAFSLPGSASNGPSEAEIEVEWDEDGMGFEVESSKGISNVIVLLCDGTAHKHEERFDEENGEVKEWEHREDQDIVAIWVKSGDNHDPDGPAPPAPFDNPGAGEYFENPEAECEPTDGGDGGDQCIGPQSVDATTMEDGILVEWSGFEGADGYNVYRKTDGAYSLLTTTDGDTTEHKDTSVTDGITYTYTVTAEVDEQETESCDEASATAIPVFPTLAATGLAMLGAVGAYGALRRRG